MPCSLFSPWMPMGMMTKVLPVYPEPCEVLRCRLQLLNWALEMELTQDEKVLRGLLQFFVCADARRVPSEAPLNLKYRDLILTAFEAAVEDGAIVAHETSLIPAVPSNIPNLEETHIFAHQMWCQHFSLPLHCPGMEDADGAPKESQATPGPKRSRWQWKKNKSYRRFPPDPPGVQRSEVKNQQAQLLEQCTKTLQAILAKLQNTGLTCEQRDKYQAMAHQMHQKIESIKPAKKRKKKKREQFAPEHDTKACWKAGKGARRKEGRKKNKQRLRHVYSGKVWTRQKRKMDLNHPDDVNQRAWNREKSAAEFLEVVQMRSESSW